MIYFFPPFTKENIEARYKELAKEFHPDKGGTDKLMQRLNAEKEEALKLVGKGIPKKIKMVRRPPGKVSVLNLNINPKDAATFVKELRKLFK